MSGELGTGLVARRIERVQVERLFETVNPFEHKDVPLIFCPKCGARLAALDCPNCQFNSHKNENWLTEALEENDRTILFVGRLDLFEHEDVDLEEHEDLADFNQASWASIWEDR